MNSLDVLFGDLDAADASAAGSPGEVEARAGVPSSRRARRARRARRTRTLPGTVAAVALALIGVGIMLYPSAASWFSDLRQHSELGGYAEQVENTDPAVLAARLEAARQYNAALPGGALRDPFANVVDGPLDAAARDYLGEVIEQPGDVMAELRIPGIAALLPVFHGTSEQTLRRGIGHLYGSSLPVGGPGTHAVLTGHRGYPEATMFSNLDRMAVGDTFTITVLGETLTYRVSGTEVVLPEDTASLAMVPGRDLVTLITCTPTGINTHRLLVHAERTADEGAHSAAAEVALPLPWWLLVAAVALLLGVIVVVRQRIGGQASRP